MSVYSGPDIITDGLVLYLDAANQKSYPGSGTTWSDISGNGNIGTLTNGPTYSTDNKGCIVFDGTNDYSSSTNVNNAWAFGTNGTVNCWINIVSRLKNNPRLFSVNNNLNSIDAFLAGDTFYNLGICGGSGAITQSEISPNTWVMLTIQFTSGAVKIFFNGSEQTIGSGATSGYNINNTDTLYLARFRLSGYELGCKISSFSIYNRSLTQDEIQQNYLATKSRYGL